MNRLTFRFVQFALMSALMSAPALAQEGGGGGGGGGASGTGKGGLTLDNFAEAIRQRIETRELNRLVEDYLVQRRYESIPIPAVKYRIELMVQMGLVDDVRYRVQYVPKDECTAKARDKKEFKVVGASTSSRRGQPICFNVPKNASDFFVAGLERATNDLIALALHEHSHQFEHELGEDVPVLATRNEQQARAVAGAVLNTLASSTPQGSDAPQSPDAPQGGSGEKTLPQTLEYIKSLMLSFESSNPTTTSANTARITHFNYSGCSLSFVKETNHTIYLNGSDARWKYREELLPEVPRDNQIKSKEKVEISLENVSEARLMPFVKWNVLELVSAPGFTMSVSTGPGSNTIYNILGGVMEKTESPMVTKRERTLVIPSSADPTESGLLQAFQHAVKLCYKKSPF